MDATLNGILDVDKPAGPSSARVVDRVKRLLPRGTKVGHAGTLDPFATGVLLVLVGKATKQCEQLMGQPKRYLATVKLGATTPTLDLTSEETTFVDAKPMERAAVESVLRRLTGEISQRPPEFSALKVGGRRAYDLARAGQAVELQPRTVHIYRMTLVDYTWPYVTLDIDCGRGTYVRSIARDVGEMLGVGGGYLTALRRIRVGMFDVKDAVNPEALRSSDDVARAIRLLVPLPPGEVR
jgi:tRNA pseudouridine55 synthase